MKAGLALVLCLVGATAIGADYSDIFRDNSPRPVEVVEKTSEQRGDLVVHDISFKGAAARNVPAYLVVPPGKGPFPAVLYVHWLGNPETSNRTQFLHEAEDLSQRGVVALLVEMPWSKVHWFRDRKMADDYDFSVQQVQSLRTALDVLAQRPDVDRKRIAYVGHDFGASYGAMLLGIDSRIHYAVLMAGTPILSDWFLLGSKLDEDRKQAYIKKMAPLDPMNYVGKAQSVPILFQFATHDEYIAKDKADLFANAASAPKELRWYETSHAMSPQASADRLEWLEARLRLTKKRSGQLKTRN